MINVHKMTDVAIAMQSALGAAKTISGITKAAPGVVTGTHDFSNGDFVVLSVQGMWQLNGRVFRVCNISTTVSFQLEDISGGTGISTVNFDTFSSGTANKITFGVSIISATSIEPTGGDFGFIDTTTIHTNQKTQIPGVAEPITKKFTHIWDIADAGQIAMKTASDNQAQLAFKLTYGTGGPIEVFTGYVGFTGSPSGSAQDKITSPAIITAFGPPSYYSA
jgi:hypothetical protein